jgi:DNA replication protein DnaC
MELDHLLEKLKMDHLQAQLDAVCEQAAQRQADYKTFLVQALLAEWQGRHQRGIEIRLRQARFPWLKTLEQFDFEFQPSLDRRQVRELAGMSFVERAHNVIVLGPPGVGKTHLAIALGIKAVEAGYSVLFLTLEELIGRLVRAAKESRLERSLQQLTYPKVLIIDEIGYLPLSNFEASLFFRLVVRRYERASMIITSNKSFLPALGRRHTWIGARSSATQSLRPPSSIGYCTTRPRSTSRGRVTGSRRSAGRACLVAPCSPKPPRRRWQQKSRASGHQPR